MTTELFNLYSKEAICSPLKNEILNIVKKIRRFVDLGFVKTCDELVKSDRIWHRCQSQRGCFSYDGTLPLSLLNVSIFQTLEEEL